MAAKKDSKFANKLRERIKKWDDSWRLNTEQYHWYMRFIMGEQWDSQEQEALKSYKKIPLVVNKLGSLSNHLLGQQRQNTPNLQIVPNANVPERTAKVRAALIKEISLNSHARVVYQTAFQQSSIGGFGAYRIGTEYADDDTFDQDIKIYDIRDPTKCYWDVSSESPCKTDGMYAGFRKYMSREKFRSLYGKKIERQIQTDNADTILNSFVNEDSITLIFDYERKYKPFTLYDVMYPDGSNRSMREEELKMLSIVVEDGVTNYYDEESPVVVRDERKVDHYKIKFRLIAGDYILEEADFHSKQLPIIFVDQNSYWDKNGRQVCRPFFKDAKDSQRFLNYIATQSAYVLKVSRYDQFMVSKANVKSADTQAAWRDPSTYLGGLFYDESPSGAKPERLIPPELSQSLTIQYQRGLDDIKSCTGIYDTQLGDNGNETSGKAIDARTKRGSYNTYVPFDALNRAIACGGEVINEMIPDVYDTERLISLDMPETGVGSVAINKPQDEYEGSPIENDMISGKYKIRLLPGPSTEDQKTEDRQSMELILQHAPELFMSVADLYAENLPSPNTIEIKNRLKAMIDPRIIESGKTGQPPPKDPSPSPEEQAAMMQQQAMIAKIQNDQMALKARMQESQNKNQIDQEKLKIEWEKLDAQRIEAAAKLQEQTLRYAAEMQRSKSDESMNHANNLVRLLTSNANHLKK